MKFFISVILLLFSVDAQIATFVPSAEVEVAINGPAPYRFRNKELIELAGLFGCAYGCTYKPLNIPQFAVCTAATHLGDKINYLSTCGALTERSHLEVPKCQENQESMANGAANCVWVPIPESWEDTLFFKGFCLPKMIADNSAAFLGTLSAFKPLFQSFKELEGQPTIVDMMTCLKESNTVAANCANVRGGRQCAPCDDIPAKYYPSTTSFTITRLCLPASMSVACTLLKEAATDKERPYCPLKDVKAKLPKACEPDECPQKAACPA